MCDAKDVPEVTVDPDDVIAAAIAEALEAVSLVEVRNVLATVRTSTPAVLKTNLDKALAGEGEDAAQEA